MGIALDLAGFRRTRWTSFLARFVYGGVVTALAGVLGHRFGAAIGGLFLAFPALLPASLTLVKQQDGRAKAADDAAGATCGAVGLVAFAAVVWLGAPRTGVAVALPLAALAWLLVSVVGWKLLDVYKSR